MRIFPDCSHITPPPVSAVPEFLHCPGCGSKHISPVSLSGRKRSPGWHCHSCGTRFPDIQEMDRRLKHCASAKSFFFLLLLLFSITSAYLSILSPTEPFMQPILWISVSGTLVSLTAWLFCRVRFDRIYAARHNLIKQCRS